MNMPCLPLNEEDFARQYSRLVARLIRPFFLQGAEQDDLYQEGMMGLLSAIRGFDPSRSDNFEAFATLCVKRRLYDALRRDVAANGRHKQLLNQLLSTVEYSADDISNDPETEVLANESAKELQTALSGLLSAFEASVLEHYLKGFTVSEIAGLLHRPAKSVDNAISRIRRKLRQYLATAGASCSQNKSTPEKGTRRGTITCTKTKP